MLLPLAAAPWLTTWLTTIWLIGVGTLLGLGVLLLLWGLLFLVRRKAAAEVTLGITEGVLLPLTFIVVFTAAFGIVGAFFARDPVTILQSIPRLPYAGQQTVVATIPTGDEVVEVPVNFQGSQLKSLSLSADRLVKVSVRPTDDDSLSPPVEIGPTDIFNWDRNSGNDDAFAGDFVENLYVTNLTNAEATLTIEFSSGPLYPQTSVVVTTAISVVLLYLLYFIQAWCFPKISAIALATTKSEIAQPLFGIILAVGVFLIILFLFLPYNTFGEDIKMLKDSGLTLIMILAIIQGVWGASNSVSEEIEGRTALTVLSKPIGRRQFIIGKVLGILWTVVFLFIVLGSVFLLVVAYKPVYDAREIGSEIPQWQLAFIEVTRTVPGLVLAFFETTVLVTLSVAISTRLPMLANFVICFSIYVLGHLTPLIVQAPIDFPPVVFVGQLIATILPVLDHFNIQAAIAAGLGVPSEYLVMAFIYCVLYSLIALLLALALFEDRDLA